MSNGFSYFDKYKDSYTYLSPGDKSLQPNIEDFNFQFTVDQQKTPQKQQSPSTAEIQLEMENKRLKELIERIKKVVLFEQLRVKTNSGTVDLMSQNALNQMDDILNFGKDYSKLEELEPILKQMAS